MSSTPQLDLGGGRLDLGVVRGRLAVFVIPTPEDLSAYAWDGEVRGPDGTLLASIDFDVTDSQATVRLPASSTATFPARAQYEIALTAPGGDPQTLLAGVVSARGGVIS